MPVRKPYQSSVCAILYAVMSADVEHQRLHCNSCRRETKHVVLHKTFQEGYVEVSSKYEEGGPDGFSWKKEVKTLECCGCQEATLQGSYASEWEQEPDVVVYPPRMSRWLPSWRWEMPKEFTSLLTEIYRA